MYNLKGQVLGACPFFNKGYASILGEIIRNVELVRLQAEMGNSMNWFVNLLIKESARRRFAPDDRVRVFTERRKGTGKNIVLTPSFTRGKVVDYDPETRHYRVWTDRDQSEISVHPRNIVPDSVQHKHESPESVSTLENNLPAKADEATQI